MPDATIAIPFHGSDATALRLAIRSVFAQTFVEWRLILLDDGATKEMLDDTRSISDARVSLVSDGRRRGLAARLNQAANLSATEYLFRMDADDVMMPDRLELQLRLLMADPNVDVVGSRAIAIDQDDGILGLYREGALPAHSAGYLKSNAFTHPTVAGRTKWFLRNPYDESISRAEDKELWLRTSNHSNFTKLDEPTLFYRVPTHFNRDKALATLRDDRRVTLTYAGQFLDPFGRVKTGVRLYAKQMAFNVAGRALWPCIRRRHIVGLDMGEKEKFERILERISRATVAGWNTP